MAVARIVTDSAADLPPQLADELGITVLPLHFQLGSEMLTDGPELRSPEFYKRLTKSRTIPLVMAPAARDFADVYGQLCRETDDIVSIHHPARFSRTMSAAMQGRTGLLGRCQVNVVDCQFVSEAQGVLVVEAAQAARDGAAGADIVKLIRGWIARSYMAFHVEALDYLRRTGIYRASSENSVASAPATAGMKPLLMLEDGQVLPLQRLRSRGTPTERLAEFVAEFADLDQVSVLHSGVGPDPQELKSKLQELFPNLEVGVRIYGPVFGAAVGTTALAVAAFEG
ncbi:MAG: DegV family protein [Anaerolineae bacterium]